MSVCKRTTRRPIAADGQMNPRSPSQQQAEAITEKSHITFNKTRSSWMSHVKHISLFCMSVNISACLSALIDLIMAIRAMAHERWPHLTSDPWHMAGSALKCASSWHWTEHILHFHLLSIILLIFFPHLRTTWYNTNGKNHGNYGLKISSK